MSEHHLSRQSPSRSPHTMHKEQNVNASSKMRPLWQGVLEWTKAPNNIREEPRTMFCPMTVYSKNEEISLWPTNLRMELVPKNQLVRYIGADFIENSKTVEFQTVPCEALVFLNASLCSGYVGYVRFASQPPSLCNTKVLIFLFLAEKNTYYGVIPNDQECAAALLRRMNQHQHTAVNVIKEEQSVRLEGTFGELQPLVESLKCPVCLTFLEREIVQCLNGHYICKGCKIYCETCPTCRRSFSNVEKNTVIQQLLKMIPHRCRFDECSYFVKAHDDHELYCWWRPTQCKLCMWSGHVLDLKNHVRNDHQSIVAELIEMDVNKFSIISDWFNDDFCFVMFISIFGHYLWVMFFHELGSGVANYVFCPVVMGKPVDIWVKLSLVSGSHETNFKKRIKVRANVDSYTENCIRIPVDLLMEYKTNENSTIPYQIVFSR